MIIRKQSQSRNHSDSIHRYVDTKRRCLTNGLPWNKMMPIWATPHNYFKYLSDCWLPARIGDMICFI